MQRSQPHKCRTCASVSRWTRNWDERHETRKVNAELPHVFLKHKNEKTGMEKKIKAREMWKKKKKGSTAAWKGRGGRVETLVVGCEGAYKPNSTLMVNGGLR